MAKMRGIKPEIWTDDKFVELSPLARLLFIGMWNFACDNGHLDDKPKQIKMRVLPTDSCDVSKLLAEMAAVGVIERADGVITIPNLPLHQRIDKRYLTTCTHCDHDVDTTGARREPSVNTTGTPGEGRKEGEGIEGEGERKSAPKRAVKLSKDWKPTPEHLERALAADLDLGKQADKFRAHAVEKGRTAVNWNAAFTRWLMNAEEYAQRDRPASAGPADKVYVDFSTLPDGLGVEEYDAWYRNAIAEAKAKAAGR